MSKVIKKSNQKEFLYYLPSYLFIIFIIWFLITFFIYPNINLIAETFFPDGTLDFSAIQQILRSDRAINAIKNSFILAITMTVTSNIIGIFQVLVTEYFDIKGSRLLRVGYMNTLIFGGVILVNGYVLVYGDEGTLTTLLKNFLPFLDNYSFSGFWAVLFIQTFATTSGHMIYLRNAVNGLDNGVIEASQNLGGSNWETLRNVVLPMLKPTLLTLIVNTFAAGLGAFAAPLIVGGRDFQTISPLILTFANRPASRDLAAVMSIFLGFFQIIMLVVITYYERKGHYLSIAKTKTKIKKQTISNKLLNILTHVFAYILLIINVLPFISVILFSFMDTAAIGSGQLSFDSFTLEHYSSVILNPTNYGPLLRSVIYSAIASLVSVIYMVMVARLVIRSKNKWIKNLEFGFYIPILLPTLLMILGLIMSYSSPNPLMFNQVIVGSSWAIPLVYLLTLLPSTLRYIKAALYSFDSNLEEASQNLGASRIRTFLQIIIPGILPTLLALFALNFNSNLSEYDISAFLYQPGAPTLGVVIRNNADPQATIDARAINLVYSVIIMVINAITLYYVYGRGSDGLQRKKAK
ncbi:ABC transporter permease [Fundicoccus culcitae]|uniref:Iron ABC transporter permease n=1 Tax=Fundicoccus culcitae TaxID=2969821 RepID=A0ABY5P5N7_9LACT|nr:iron ABC transporter permease [Fundicoccus culcitae]UUX33886.1 iron ABC transporter permease [Fundicoccus culcitae]